MNIKFKYRCHLSYVFVGVINFTRPSHREENGYTPHNFFFFYLFIFSSAIKKMAALVAQQPSAPYLKEKTYILFSFLKKAILLLSFSSSQVDEKGVDINVKTITNKKQNSMKEIFICFLGMKMRAPFLKWTRVRYMVSSSSTRKTKQKTSADVTIIE